MLEHALKMGSSVTEACQYAGIGRRTYYDELTRNEAFANRMACARSNLIRKAKIIVADAIIVDHDLKMAMWYLAHRDPGYR